jgi:hypothetical protein
MKTALGVIEANALFGEEERPVFLRVGSYTGSLFLDLCDRDWRAIEVDSRGWRIIDRPPISFRRTKGMLPLQVPVAGGTIHELRRFVPATDDAFVLIVSWLLAALRDTGPYPVLALTGEQGSAKSTVATVLRRLVDPHSTPLRGAPRDSHDLYIAANNGHTVALDNLSEIPPDLADSMCRLATGGGFATRKLYTDTDEILFSGQRPQLLTSITQVPSARRYGRSRAMSCQVG